MSAVQYVFMTLAVAFAVFLGYQVRLNTDKPDMTTRVIRDMSPDKELVKHSEEFQKKEIRKVRLNLRYYIILFCDSNISFMNLRSSIRIQCIWVVVCLSTIVQWKIRVQATCMWLIQVNCDAFYFDQACWLLFSSSIALPIINEYIKVLRCDVWLFFFNFYAKLFNNNYCCFEKGPVDMWYYNSTV